MRILFTICGRAGSKGIKNKNIRDFLGKKLPYYAISAIDLYLKEGSEKTDYDIVVSSDSEELLDIMQNNPLRKVEIIRRGAELAGDSIGKIMAIEDCLTRMETKKEYKYDLVVDLDITSPLRRVEDIRRVIETHIERKADVTTTVTAARRNPYFNQVKKVEHGYKKVIDSKYTARQQAPEVFDMNAAIYAYDPAYLHSGKGVLDGYCECVEMYDTGILDLDHENDFELMEVIARHLFERDKKYAVIYNNIE